MKTYENLWTPKENLWKPMNTYEHLRKTYEHLRKTYENLWKPKENLWKPKENLWKHMATVSVLSIATPPGWRASRRHNQVQHTDGSDVHHQEVQRNDRSNTCFLEVDGGGFT